MAKARGSDGFLRRPPEATARAGPARRPGPANDRPRPQAASRVRPTVEETMMSNGRRVPSNGSPMPPRGPRPEGFRGYGGDYDQMASGRQADGDGPRSRRPGQAGQAGQAEPGGPGGPGGPGYGPADAWHGQAGRPGTTAGVGRMGRPGSAGRRADERRRGRPGARLRSGRATVADRRPVRRDPDCRADATGSRPVRRRRRSVRARSAIGGPVRAAALGPGTVHRAAAAARGWSGVVRTGTSGRWPGRVRANRVGSDGRPSQGRGEWGAGAPHAGEQYGPGPADPAGFGPGQPSQQGQ